MIRITKEKLLSWSKEMLFLEACNKKGEQLVEIIDKKENIISIRLSGLNYYVK
jgi:hypothetical protein